MKILVVDDDADVREFFEFALTGQGYRVKTAAGGAEGLELARRWSPEVILLDLMMPGMHGLEVLESLGTTGRSRPYVIVATGHAAHDERALALGASAVVYKPIEPAFLFAVVRDVLVCGCGRSAA